MERITLASASPRRKELMERLGLTLDIVIPETEEIMTITSNEKDLAQKLSKEKLEDVKKRTPEALWIVASDTFIYFDGKCLGKPRDRKEAEEMLKALSGKTHQVVTGIAVYSKRKNRLITDADCSTVTFNNLSNDDLNWYLDTGEWKDAAGAYKIQEKGECLVKEIKGSFSSIMGLPINRLYGILKTLNFNFRQG